jgi:predicted enzyme related to lactoylglutathione lyase
VSDAPPLACEFHVQLQRDIETSYRFLQAAGLVMVARSLEVKSVERLFAAFEPEGNQLIFCGLSNSFPYSPAPIQEIPDKR